MSETKSDQNGAKDRERDTTIKQTSSATTGTNDEKHIEDPGITPGSAEGDEETVKESIRQKE